MHIFISAGEPSGDLHAANLVRVLRDRVPDLRFTGFGGDRLAAAGAELLYPLTDLAVMWLGRALVHLPTFLKVARRAEVHFRSARPDAVILVDYPGFNFALAKRAHRAGIPVYYFVPPQLWGWLGYRSEKMRKWVRTVMTALPFEDEWYRSRGVHTHYVGHPYFDELAEQKPDAGFVASLRQVGTPVVGLLPGSRNQEVGLNFPLMVAAAAKVGAAVPTARFVVAAFNDRQARAAREMAAGSGVPVTIHVRRTPEIIEAADACVAVSGSVGLELLCRLKPSVVVYKVAPAAMWIARQLKTSRYISLVNLLAGEELYPEFLTTRDESAAIAGRVIEWLTDPAAKAKLVGQLTDLRSRVAVPGACDRAADYLLGELARRPGFTHNSRSATGVSG